MSDVVTHESQDAISIITLNRPEKMNALNEELILSLQEKLKSFQETEINTFVFKLVHLIS